MGLKLSKNLGDGQRGRLESEKDKIIKQIEELKKDDPFSDPDHVLDNAAVDTDVREEVGHETIVAQINTLERRIQDIEIALKKIAKGSYGICERCRKMIPQARLKLIPEARFCIDCEKKLRK